jgi:hypothetical protein
MREYDAKQNLIVRRMDKKIPGEPYMNSGDQERYRV